MTDDDLAEFTATPPPPPAPGPRPAPTDESSPSGRHPVNIGHLAMGLVFLAFVAMWALVQSGAVTGDDVHWLLPVPWVVGGAVGVAVALLGGVRRRR